MFRQNSVGLTLLHHVLAVHEEEERVLLLHLDSLPDDVSEVVSEEIVGHEISAQKVNQPKVLLVLVDVGQLRGLRLLADHWDPVRVPLQNSLRLCLSRF